MANTLAYQTPAGYQTMSEYAEQNGVTKPRAYLLVSSGQLEYMKRGDKRFIKIGAQVVDPWSWVDTSNHGG
jgi:hypothetical protein